MVLLTEVGASRRGAYRVRAWLFGDKVSDVLGTKREVALDELPGLLTELSEAAAMRGAVDCLIEFVVPQSMLNNTFHRCLIRLREGGRDWYLGARHPVVVRAAERLSGGLLKRIQQRWSRNGVIHDLPCGASSARGLSRYVEWLSETDSDRKLKERKEVVCVLLDRPLDVGGYEWELMCSEGIPIGLWPCDGPALPREEMERLVELMKLGDLRMRLCSLRLDPGGTAAPSWIERLTVLWDDPSRVPRDQILRRPKKREARQ